MSGYVFALGACLRCGRRISFNPDTVPSLNNEPICAPCVKAIQTFQREHNLAVWPDPLPGAYEPAEA